MADYCLTTTGRKGMLCEWATTSLYNLHDLIMTLGTTLKYWLGVTILITNANGVYLYYVMKFKISKPTDNKASMDGRG